MRMNVFQQKECMRRVHNTMLKKEILTQYIKISFLLPFYFNSVTIAGPLTPILDIIEMV